MNVLNIYETDDNRKHEIFKLWFELFESIVSIRLNLKW